MTERFRQHLSESGLVPEGCTVVLGYSGGADSTCLLHLMAELGTADVIAVHLHHGQRAEADKELELCEAFCKELDVPFMSGRADVPKIAKEMGVGLEEAGRHARYEFFDQCLSQTSAELVLTAHTLDDQVETVLLNLVRGTGLRGLSGIPEKRGQIVRPLLPFTRAEARAYCDERGLWYHDDPANADVSFSRARIRHKVLPELVEVNPAVRESIGRLARLADDEDRFLDGMAAAALEQAEVPLNGDLRFVSQDCEAAFRLEVLLALPRVLLARAVRLATGAVGQAFGYEQTEAALGGLASEEKGSVTADGGQVVLEWGDGRATVRSLRTEGPYKFPLTLPGETVSDVFGWKLTAEHTGPSNYLRAPRSLDVVIDAEAVRGELFFRSYEGGDRIRPLGLSGTKKLGDLLGEIGLTQAARARLPVVCDSEGPIWVPGGCIAERVKVTDGTAKCLRLRFAPL
ncbi:MAG: tRNA lysidine(34) synthetase TilS [Armatimonadetes bacterium]|nr:tRNA lysidine(34) synthetase TilS [Armatimonadota bacterium]